MGNFEVKGERGFRWTIIDAFLLVRISVERLVPHFCQMPIYFSSFKLARLYKKAHKDLLCFLVISFESISSPYSIFSPHSL